MVDVLVAGSYRRRKETVGDLDMLVIAESGGLTSERLADYPRVAEVISKGTTRATVMLESGIQVDVRVISPHCAGAALHYFTGAKAHNIQIRRLGQQRGLKINEYGVFRKDKRIAGKTEASVFKAVGLPYIEPELREGRGEIAAAKKGELPDLVAREDLLGDLHVPYSSDDGSVERWVQAAVRNKLTYLALALPWPRRRSREHSRELDEFQRALETVRTKRKRFGLLSALEVSIPEDGTLDIPAAVREQVDLIIGTLDNHFDLSAKVQTRRILKAMDMRGFSILAHPLARIIPKQPGLKIDINKIIKHARERDCFLELDARPDRLDLPDEYCRVARDEGALISISSLAATPPELSNLDFGIDQARRGWLEPKNVVNTRSLAALRKLLSRQ